MELEIYKLLMKLAIVDYGVGNIQSILNAFSRLDLKLIRVSKEKEELTKMDGLILPGVGAFGTCAAKLKRDGLIDILNELVIIKKKTNFRHLCRDAAYGKYIKRKWLSRRFKLDSRQSNIN